MNTLKITNEYGYIRYFVNNEEVNPPANICWEFESQVDELPEWAKEALEMKERSLIPQPLTLNPHPLRI